MSNNNSNSAFPSPRAVGKAKPNRCGGGVKICWEKGAKRVKPKCYFLKNTTHVRSLITFFWQWVSHNPRVATTGHKNPPLQIARTPRYRTAFRQQLQFPRVNTHFLLGPPFRCNTHAHLENCPKSKYSQVLPPSLSGRKQTPNVRGLKQVWIFFFLRQYITLQDLNIG